MPSCLEIGLMHVIEGLATSKETWCSRSCKRSSSRKHHRSCKRNSSRKRSICHNGSRERSWKLSWKLSRERSRKRRRGRDGKTQLRRDGKRRHSRSF